MNESNFIYLIESACIFKIRCWSALCGYKGLQERKKKKKWFNGIIWVLLKKKLLLSAGMTESKRNLSAHLSRPEKKEADNAG